MQGVLPVWADHERWKQFQEPVYEQVMAGFEEGHRLVLLDAPPGAGKSLLGYMTFASLALPSYYLVGTKYLQNQIARTLPGVRIIKGRANYVPTDIPYEYETYQPTCADCDKDEMFCTFCSDVEMCPYTVAKGVAQDADLACANYAFALGEWSGRSAFRNRGLVICDEADTLAAELKSYVSVSISQRWQRRLGLRPPAKKTVETSWPSWFEYAIPKLESYLNRMPRRSLHDKRDYLRLERLLDKMKDITQDFDGWVYDYTAKKDLDEQPIQFKPVKVDKLAPNTLWNNGERFLCMSASLGSPEVFVNELGWTDSYAPVFAGSTFAKERRPIYFIPSAVMVHKKTVTEWPKMAKAVATTLNLRPDKRTLVLPHTYPFTTHLKNYLRDYTDIERPIFCYENSEEREGAIAAFEECEDELAPVLLAPSLGRGYDNPALRLVVICKVPYPDLGSKQVSKRQRMPDGQLWYANETCKTIIQACGRAMRGEDDEGETIILDAMFSSFYSDWKRLFPEHLKEAVDFNSPLRFELKQAMRDVLTHVGPR